MNVNHLNRYTFFFTSHHITHFKSSITLLLPPVVLMFLQTALMLTSSLTVLLTVSWGSSKGSKAGRLSSGIPLSNSELVFSKASRTHLLYSGSLLLHLYCLKCSAAKVKTLLLSWLLVSSRSRLARKCYKVVCKLALLGTEFCNWFWLIYSNMKIKCFGMCIMR